jgi:hypothetical protein
MPTQPGDLPIDSSQVGGTELAERLNRILPDVVTNSAAIAQHKTDPNPHPQYMAAGAISAGSITLQPGGGISSTQVQAAIHELDQEKVSKAGSLVDGTDLNTVVDSGFYRLQGTHPNMPAVGYGQLLVIHGAADTIAQMAFSYGDAQMYFRAGNPPNVGGNGAWGAWKTACWAGGGNASGTWNITVTGWAHGLAGNSSGNTDSHPVLGGDGAIKTHIWAEAANGRFGFLDAAGNAKIYSDQTGNFIAAGNITAYSDIRLKTDFKVIGDALDKVQQLTGYTFTRIDSGERQAGLIAQDVQKVMPEVVKSESGMKEDDPDTLVLAYGNMAGLFVEAIKELRAEGVALRAEVAELRGA